VGDHVRGEGENGIVTGTAQTKESGGGSSSSGVRDGIKSLGGDGVFEGKSPFVMTGWEACVGLHGGAYDVTEELSGLSLKVTNFAWSCQSATEISEQCATT
jgi:hypothetical protein